MAAGNNVGTQLAPYTLTIERIFDAPRELIFEAWTDPKHLVHWLGPKGFTGVVIKMDVRPGGAYRFYLRSTEGVEYWQQGVFREVIKPERFVRTCIWADADGNPTSPEMLMTVTFADHNGKTKLKFEQVFETAAAREAHRSGTASALDRLAAYLATLE
jgi:uncharacterized protein YndB with AHSA1/START domain